MTMDLFPTQDVHMVAVDFHPFQVIGPAPT